MFSVGRSLITSSSSKCAVFISAKSASLKIARCAQFDSNLTKLFKCQIIEVILQVDRAYIFCRTWKMLDQIECCAHFYIKNIRTFLNIIGRSALQRFRKYDSPYTSVRTIRLSKDISEILYYVKFRVNLNRRNMTLSQQISRILYEISHYEIRLTRSLYRNRNFIRYVYECIL